MPICRSAEYRGETGGVPEGSAQNLGSEMILPKIWAIAKVIDIAGGLYVGQGDETHCVGQYGRSGDLHINTFESIFSILKHGIISASHHFSETHLQCHMAELAFRCNDHGSNGFERPTGSLLGATVSD